MKKRLYTILFLLCACSLWKANRLYAQHAYFPEQGTISYDKTVHIKNILKKQMAKLQDGDFTKSYYEQLLNNLEETIVLKKKLLFMGNVIRYESLPGTYPPAVNNLFRSGLLDSQPTVYQDLSKSEVKSAFDLEGTAVVIQDSLLNVKWKITNEYRTIAGYECRRANGIALDSTYVVAFYTDQIPTSGGPGTLHGLPGMILGLVVPEQHYNIYATEVRMDQPVINSNIGKKKAKVMKRKNMKEEIDREIGNNLLD